MSITKSFTQTSIERKRRSVNYSNWLDDGEVLSDHAIVVSPLTDPPFVAEDGFSSDADTQITFYTSGGLSGVPYIVKMVATTSESQIKEDDIQILVFG